MEDPASMRKIGVRSLSRVAGATRLIASAGKVEVV
jgi:hypothetical protein